MKTYILKFGLWISLFAFPITLISVYGSEPVEEAQIIHLVATNKVAPQKLALIDEVVVKEENQASIDQLEASLLGQINQPDILKEDILRGWYLGNENEKRYGTPDSWIFAEDGKQSKWISPL